jgi:enamine deaminase RidA (YjgF/YER057c/UK114 family)
MPRRLLMTRGARVLGMMPSSSPAIASTSATVSVFQQRRHVHVEHRLRELGIVLPPAPSPKANYNIACHASGNLLFVSGHLPLTVEGELLKGKIGSTGQSVQHGYQAARWCGLNMIATLQAQLGGNLDRVEQIVKVFGMVQSCEDFKEQHLVMDGCSDVLMQVFQQPVGYHARSAMGTSTLPLDMSVEVECIVQIKPE